MGLAVSVADLALFMEEEDLEPDEVEYEREAYERLSNFLVSHNMPPHNEPESVPELPSRGEYDGFPYSWIHFLRRAYAYRSQGMALEPFSGERATEDPVLRAAYDKNQLLSHLIHHSDAEGFYVPIDFLNPLVAEREGEIPGDIVGSSYGLLRELVLVAPAIGIHLSNDQLLDEEAAILLQEDHPFATERMVWFTLYEGARKSIELGAAIRFG